MADPNLPPTAASMPAVITADQSSTNAAGASSSVPNVRDTNAAGSVQDRRDVRIIFALLHAINATNLPTADAVGAFLDACNACDTNAARSVQDPVSVSKVFALLNAINVTNLPTPEYVRFFLYICKAGITDFRIPRDSRFNEEDGGLVAHPYQDAILTSLEMSSPSRELLDEFDNVIGEQSMTVGPLDPKRDKTNATIHADGVLAKHLREQIDSNVREVSDLPSWDMGRRSSKRGTEPPSKTPVKRLKRMHAQSDDLQAASAPLDEAPQRHRVHNSGFPVLIIKDRSSSVAPNASIPPSTHSSPRNANLSIERDLLQMPIHVYVPSAVNVSTGTWLLATNELHTSLSARLMNVIRGRDYVKKVHERRNMNSEECIISSSLGRRACASKRTSPRTACVTCVKKGRTCAVFLPNDAGIGFFPIAQAVSETQWNDFSRYCSNDRESGGSSQISH